MSSTLRAAALVLAALLLSACSGSPNSAVTVTTTVTAPAPTVTVTLPASDSSETSSPLPDEEPLTDGQRSTLDANFGRDWGRDGPLGTYCPMDGAGRSDIAERVARQFEGYTTALVLAYLEEVCAEL